MTSVIQKPSVDLVSSVQFYTRTLKTNKTQLRSEEAVSKNVNVKTKRPNTLQYFCQALSGTVISLPGGREH